MKITKIISSLFVAISFSLISCSDDEGQAPNGGMSNEETVSVIEKTANVENNVDWVLDAFVAGLNPSGFNLWKTGLGDCVQITQQPTDNGTNITVNFGEGCQDEYGNVYSGVVNIMVVNLENTTQVQKNFTNLGINAYTLSGEITTMIGDQDYDNDGDLERVANRAAQVAITDSTGVTNNRNAQHVIVRTQGEDGNPSISKIFSITGSATNALSTGVTWNMNITSPIIRPQTCNFYAVQGAKVITSESLGQSFYIDYGDGECDGVVNVTMPNGNIVQVNQFF